MKKIIYTDKEVKNTTESKETNIVVKFPKMKLYDMTEETGDISYIY